MLPLGLSVQQQQAFHATLASSHQIRITALLLDLEHRKVNDLSGRVLGGQVSIDTGAENERSLTIDLYDPERRMGLDDDNPATIPTYPRYMLRVYRGVRGPADVADRIDVPLFTGPISDVDRKGDIITVQAKGKEDLARRAVHPTRSWPKGTRKTQIITDLLRMAGEIDICIQCSPSTAVVTAPYSVTADQDLWTALRTIAGTLGWSSWYDARGVTRIGRTSQLPVFTLSTGADGTIIQYPTHTFDVESMTTRVVVTGAKPDKVGTVAPRAVASVPADYPLSPQSISRRGVGMAWTEFIDDSDVGSLLQAQKVAREKLDERIIDDYVSLALECLPIPHLEPRDYVRVQTPEYGFTLQVNKLSIPLGHAEHMTVGVTARVSTRPTTPVVRTFVRPSSTLTTQPARRSL